MVLMVHRRLLRHWTSFLHVKVMDPKSVTNDKVLRDRKPDHTLISFFGDDSYGWFPKGRDIVPFSNNYTAKSKQAAAKKASAPGCRTAGINSLCWCNACRPGSICVQGACVAH